MNAGSTSPFTAQGAGLSNTNANPGAAAPPGMLEMMSMMMGLMGMMLQMFSSLLGGMSGNSGGMPGLGNAAETTGSPGTELTSANPTSSADGSTTLASASPSASPAATPVATSRGGTSQGGWTRPNQMEVFDPNIRNSACGPAAVIGLAKSMGINVTPQQVIQAAGGNFSQDGMGQGQVAQLARDVGVNAYNEEGAINWDKVKSEASQGKKVVLHFEGHYYFVEGYDPATGKFDLGTSVTQFRGCPKDANGQPISQYTQDEIKNLLIPTLSSSLPTLTTQERGAIYIR